MNPEMVAQFIGYGYNWVAIGSDMALHGRPRAGMAGQGQGRTPPRR